MQGCRARVSFSKGVGGGGGGGVGGKRLTWLHAPRMMADTSEIVLVVCSTDQIWHQVEQILL